MNGHALHIRPVRSRADERAFRELPWRLYRDDPHWVAPLRRDERRRWSPAHNPALQHRITQRFLARRGGRVVGRIAAIVDPAFIERWEAAGFFGFFECDVRDDAAARALLHAAEDFLRAHGLRQVIGPINLSTHGEVGLLVEGFDSPPTLLSPYNPPAYAELVQGAGYRPARDYHAYLWTPACPHDAVLERVLRRYSGTRADDVRIRHLDPTRWDEELRTLFALYNSTFTGNWGFVPLEWEEFTALAESFRAFYRPELVIIAERDGEGVGFALLLPDINAALRPLRRRLLPFGRLRLRRAAPRLTTGRLILLGVLRGYAARGLGPRIVAALEPAVLRAGLTEVELSLVQSGNAPVRHVADAFGATLAKTYRLFSRTLEPLP